MYDRTIEEDIVVVSYPRLNSLKISGGEMSDDEIDYYVDYIMKKNPDREIDWMSLRINDPFVDCDYQLIPLPFERIRRITGYLTGTLETWNSAKISEEKDRLPHERAGIKGAM